MKNHREKYTSCINLKASNLESLKAQAHKNFSVGSKLNL